MASVRDGAQVPAVVAVAFGVREQPGVPVAEVLARVLVRQQQLLLVISVVAVHLAIQYHIN